MTYNVFGGTLNLTQSHGGGCLGHQCTQASLDSYHFALYGIERGRGYVGKFWQSGNLSWMQRC